MARLQLTDGGRSPRSRSSEVSRFLHAVLATRDGAARHLECRQHRERCAGWPDLLPDQHLNGVPRRRDLQLGTTGGDSEGGPPYRRRIVAAGGRPGGDAGCIGAPQLGADSGQHPDPYRQDNQHDGQNDGRLGLGHATSNASPVCSTAREQNAQPALSTCPVWAQVASCGSRQTLV